jgi:hypothetical protein
VRGGGGVEPQARVGAVLLALIDLDPAAEAVRGQILYWSEREGTWLSLQGRFAAFRARHPEVTVSDGSQSASWSDAGGPHTLSYGSMGPLWLIGPLEDQFDRWQRPHFQLSRVPERPRSISRMGSGGVMGTGVGWRRAEPT